MAHCVRTVAENPVIIPIRINVPSTPCTINFGRVLHIELVLDVARHPSLLTGNVLAGPGGDPVRFLVTASSGQAGVTETCSQCVFSVALTLTQLDIV